MDGLMIQICLNYNPFDLVVGLFVVILVMIEKRLSDEPYNYKNTLTMRSEIE